MADDARGAEREVVELVPVDLDEADPLVGVPRTDFFPAQRLGRSFA